MKGVEKRRRDPDRFTVTSTRVAGMRLLGEGRRSLIIAWKTKGAGFGQLTVLFDDEGVPIFVDTEAMSAGFVREVFAKLAESVVAAIN